MNFANSIRRGGKTYPDPANKDWGLVTRGNGSMLYGMRASVYFKLLALTDFETMQLYLKPKGELLIRDELVKRYGEEGGRVYDCLHYTDNQFELVLEAERLFLKLFTQRIGEVSSQSEMLSYVHLYRLYRKVFCARYASNTTRVDEKSGTLVSVQREKVHPLLNFPEADASVAAAVLKWNILNPELPEDMARAAAHVLVSAPIFEDPIHCRDYDIIMMFDPLLVTENTIRIRSTAPGVFSVNIGNPHGDYHWSNTRQTFIP